MVQLFNTISKQQKLDVEEEAPNPHKAEKLTKKKFLNMLRDEHQHSEL